MKKELGEEEKRGQETQSGKRFISILSDYGFKVSFGNESDTRFLRKAIQLLIKSELEITEVVFENNEFSALTKDSRGGLFDLTCTDASGNVYIVEMQLVDYKHFIHRGKFYAFQRMNTMIRKGQYRFDDLKKIYVISFLGGRTYSTKEFHQIGCLRNQHGELMDAQITHIVVELGKWNKPKEEVTTDLEKLLYFMKYTDIALDTDKLPTFLNEEWIDAVIKELDLRNMPQEKLAAYEMMLAREGSILAAHEAEEQARQEEIARIKEMAEKKLLEEKVAAERKLVKEVARIREMAEKKLLEEKAAAEKKLLEEKAVAEKKLLEEKAVAERKLAQEKETAIVKLLKINVLSIEQIADVEGVEVERVKQIQEEMT